jgi:hypothetical protein
MTALWPLVPPLALSGLFIASTMFTESISKGKYPAYEAYQSRVGEHSRCAWLSMVIPILIGLVGMFSPSDTLWKGLLLRARGQLEKVNAIVYGSDSHSKDE